MGIGDWGLGIGVLGVWANTTTPTHQAPNPNPKFFLIFKE